jgi:hypothetical protein
MHASRATLIAVFVVIAATAAVHGIVSNRWNGADVEAALPEIPMRIADWVGEDVPSQAAEPGIAHLARKYTHAASGRSFIVSVSYGHPGLTAIHTPEYCYTGSGYEMDGGVGKYTAKSSPAEFFTTAFQKPGGAEPLRIYWAWSADGTWRAPNNPRLTFLGKRSLCKLYVVAGGGTAAAPGQDAALDDFIAKFVSTLNGALFAPSARTLRGSPTPPSTTEAARS